MFLPFVSSEPPEGFEPPAFTLQGCCSTPELWRLKGLRCPSLRGSLESYQSSCGSSIVDCGRDTLDVYHFPSPRMKVFKPRGALLFGLEAAEVLSDGFHLGLSSRL